MATDISICSNALQMLGAKPFSDFNETREQVRTCANLYPSIRDSVLRKHSWNCATKRVLLSPMTNKPPFDFSNQFQMPANWLRTLQVGKKGDVFPYRTEGFKILANRDTLPLVYIARVDPVSWSTNLINVMELAMAAAIAYSVTASTSLAQLKDQEYQRELKFAKAIDGQDDPPEEFEEGSFVESRFS